MNDKPPIIAIPDKLASKTGLTAKWIDYNTLSVNAYDHKTTTSRDYPTNSAGHFDVNIFHIRDEFIFFDPILRELLAEASVVFSNLQSLQPGNQKQTNKIQLLKISRSYRSIIRACLAKLQETESSNDESIAYRKKLENYITIFYSIECVWHLIEILLIDTTPTNFVVPSLLEWIRFHFPTFEREAAEILLIGRDANISSMYWPIVNGLVMQGQIDVVRTLLKLHSAWETASFQLADEVLRMMPKYNNLSGMSVQKFTSQREYWIADTKSKLQAGYLMDDPELEDLIKLTIGDTDTWRTMIKNTGTNCWYEYFPGYLFYTKPACKHFELSTFIHGWLSIISMSPAASNFKHLDRVLINIMENDMPQTLNNIQNMCDNHWFVTHLTDLLFHCGHLHLMVNHETDVSKNLRDSLLFEFGSTVTSSGLWTIGIEYLRYTSNEYSNCIPILLSKIPFSNEKQAMRVINFARKMKIPELENDIARVLSRRSLANNRLGNALEWAIRSQDNGLVTLIANKYLEHYSRTGEMLTPDLLSQIGGKMFISPRLVFLVKYFDFHQFYSRREFPKASELLVNLLDSKITPKCLWPSLLADTIPLLESENPIIPSKETYKIIKHMESYLVSIDNKRQTHVENEKAFGSLHDRVGTMEQLIDLLRIAAARNLQRALILEKTLFTKV